MGIERFAIGLLYRYLSSQGLLAEEEPAAEQENQIPELGEVPQVLALKHKDGAVITIFGRRESGKSKMSYRLAEILGKPTYAVSPEEKTPEGITELAIEELETKPPPNSVLVLDDLPVYMSGRDYHDPYVQIVERLVPVVRHRRRIILIFSSQSSGQTDKYALDADLLLFKPLSILYQDTERSGVMRIYKRIEPIFKVMSDYQLKRHAYMIAHNWEGLVRINLPGQPQVKV